MTTYQSQSTLIRQRFSTLAAVTASNPVLLEGEKWNEKDSVTGLFTGRTKTGKDGAVTGTPPNQTITGTAFNDLPFDPSGTGGGGGGGASLSDATPQPLGVAAAGTAATASRGDHRHAMPTAAQVGADATGTAVAAVAAHAAAADPHAQYLTPDEADGRYRLLSTALSDSDIPAAIARDAEVTAAISAHESAADPHPGYLTSAEGNAAYAPIGQGVTNGNNHDHSGGDGAQIAYGSLSGLPTVPALSSSAPQPLGATAAAGSSTDAARIDHVHPRSTYAELGAIADGIIFTISNRGETASPSTNYDESLPLSFASTVTKVTFITHIDNTGSSTTTLSAYKKTAAGTKTSLLSANATLASGASVAVGSLSGTAGVLSLAAGDRFGVDLIGLGTGASGIKCIIEYTRSAA